MLTFLSIRTKEIIMPQCTVEFKCNSSLVYALDTVEVKTPSSKDILFPGDTIIGHSFKLTNKNTSVAAIQSLTFFIKNKPNKNICICRSYELEQLQLRYITDIFNLIHIESNFNHKHELNLINLLNDINWITSGQSPMNRHKIDNRLIKINRYIRKNYHLPLTLQQLADMLSCTPVYLCKMYSSVFGVPPMQHIQMLRMTKATELLEQTYLHVNEISERLGYASPSHFISTFRKYYNTTPKKYKQRLHMGI
ncbi:AraC-type DNA-binding protein [Fontibacillus panacisegetis]|uniref:AraC-type DNA-binding protein n=1 Tax=Fontibacillus panacisegetis TaxID=670482 RepID=A0A1G7Q1Y7_9BACL|nr:AraC family transcriptional regulator [Fontibacillus panacisegetis]SDF91640.1 AraC-type DNA-binding protein [Fontibacillus panacisegetis]